MNELAKSVSVKKLPVLATTRETLEVSWQHRKVLALWIVGCTFFTGCLCFLLEHLFSHFIWVFVGWKPVWIRVSFIFLAAFPTLMISALFSIFCHRLVLTDGKKESLFPIAIGKREWRFFGWNLFFCGATILIVLLAIIVNFLAMEFYEDLKEAYSNPVWIKTFLDHYFVDVLHYGIGSYLLASYCLVLPATAVDLSLL